jgi:hypothetical protein
MFVNPKLLPFVPPLDEKYSSSVFRKINTMIHLSRLDQEGRSANRHQTWSAGCDGPGVLPDE